MIDKIFLKKLTPLLFSMALVFVTSLGLSGCKTYAPPFEESSQPWAQPEGWQGSSLPGLGSRLTDY